MATRPHELKEKVYFSSRGRGIDPLIRDAHPFPNNLTTSVNPGAGLLHLTNLAVSDVYDMAWNEGIRESDVVIYLGGGICDITEKIRNPFERAEEVIFSEDPGDCVQRMSSILIHSVDTIRGIGCTPVIATIPPMHLEAWNWHRYSNNRTLMLLHHANYAEMQGNLETAIKDINNIITKLNYDIGCIPVYLAGTVMVNTPGKKPRIHYGRLADGVHPSPSLLDQWGHQLKKSMSKNRAIKTVDN